MKSHLKLQLAPGVVAPDAPHWSDVIADKRGAPTTIHPAIDAIFARHRVPVWVTAEYPREGANQTWSQHEIESGFDRIYRLVLQRDGQIPPSLIDEIRLLPVVRYVHAGTVAHAELPRSEALGVKTDMRSREMIKLPEAHLLTRGRRDVTIAILDTGVSLHHKELEHALLPGRDFVDVLDGADTFLGDYLDADPIPEDEVGHGTHVAGIIAAKGLEMPTGVAPRCKILPVRVLGAMKRGDKLVGAGLVENINVACKWAVDQGADVLNMSLGVRHESGGLPHAEVIEYARKKGVSVVAASGNGGSDNELYYPGALPHVITVGALDEEGEDVAAFSTYGKQVSLVAPGTNIFSSYLDDGYAVSTGTSHAAPFVAGVVGLLHSLARARGRRLRDRQVKHVLQHTADKLDRGFKNLKAGFGLLNARDALRLLEHRLAS